MLYQLSLIGLAVTAPSPSKFQDVATFNPITGVISPIARLNERVNPITEVGNIYRDDKGVTRAILVFQLTESLIQAFDNAGFNLAKAILSELLQFGRDNDFAQQVRLNTWDAEFSAAARIISDRLTFFSLAITAHGSPSSIGPTLFLQSWLEQGGKYAAVQSVADALAINKRSVSYPDLNRRDSSPDASPVNWCDAGTRGFFNLIVDKPAEEVGFRCSCPADP
ncbi:hypothetical protein NQ176_g2424 [Zarea fungicola]|uniref:Uncharacterized protein n=1 Tax=Zarea fungicola TaxID=93591 RepID=A0ACC1NPL1_9HYPO|nr:hypothetical protein NQ176_g2424 [Lecanicillium fungicola]